MQAQDPIMILTIGKIARAAGVTVETVRFYERRGLVPRPPKPHDGYRLYSPETVERIRFTRKAQERGFSLREIGDLLLLVAKAGADCGQVRAQANLKVDALNEQIAELERVRDVLEYLIAGCPGSGALPECSILAVLEEQCKENAEAIQPPV